MPIFKVGDDVVALEPGIPRYFGGRIHRVINIPREDGGPLYEVQFFQDGANFASGRSHILPESQIFEKVRTKRRKDWTETFPSTHNQEFAVENIRQHRQHSHGRLPCPFTIRTDFSRCKIDTDYQVVWVGYNYTTWEAESAFVVLLFK